MTTVEMPPPRLFVSGTVNCTSVNASLVLTPERVANPGTNTTHSHTNDVSGSGYDAEGAMKFIVATVLVYSILGVFCTLLSRFKRERGRGHLSYTQDEMVMKYVKTIKNLKLDGYRRKLMYDAHLMNERLKLMSEKNKLLQIEKDIMSDFSLQTTEPKVHNHKVKKKHEVASTVGMMGMSLCHVNFASTNQDRSSMGNTSSNSPAKTDVVINTVDINSGQIKRFEQDENVLDDACDKNSTESDRETSEFLETDV